MPAPSAPRAPAAEVDCTAVAGHCAADSDEDKTRQKTQCEAAKAGPCASDYARAVRCTSSKRRCNASNKTDPALGLALLAECAKEVAPWIDCQDKHGLR